MKRRENNNCSEIYHRDIVGISVNVSYIVHVTIRCLGFAKTKQYETNDEIDKASLTNEN